MQLSGNIFFGHLQAFAEIRAKHDDIYEKYAFPNPKDREHVESMKSPNLFNNVGRPGLNRQMRQKNRNGHFITPLQVDKNNQVEPRSAYLKSLHAQITSGRLERIDKEENYALSGLGDDAKVNSEDKIVNELVYKLALLVKKNNEKQLKESKRTALTLWPQIVARTDEMYEVYEKYEPAFVGMAEELVRQADLPTDSLMMAPGLKDPVSAGGLLPTCLPHQHPQLPPPYADPRSREGNGQIRHARSQRRRRDCRV